MKVYDCGFVGTEYTINSTWEDLKLSSPWPEVISVFSPGLHPRPAQVEALSLGKLFSTKRNLIVSAPTNSGKSLIGTLALLDSIRRGKRAVLLEPLRAIAREKTDELELPSKSLGQILNAPFKVIISTGDYRLEDEDFGAPPPNQGELIIATPERFDAILRNPAYNNWINTIDTICVDEAHLISVHKRGATLEFLITTLLCLPVPPRLILLSATIGNLERFREWLDPCDVIRTTERHPPLQTEVIELTREEDSNQVVKDITGQILDDPSTNLLVFVYQTKSAEYLAKTLTEDLKTKIGDEGALAYHAQMSTSQRENVKSAFGTERCRCVVTTSALGLGVNLPATHVIIRDITFPGIGKVNVADLLQMSGRAGRGKRSGKAIVILKPGDDWNANELVRALQTQELPGVVSQFEQEPETNDWGYAKYNYDIRPVVTSVSSLLARYPEQGLTGEAIESFFKRSLGGQAIVNHIHAALAWLKERTLAYFDENEKYHLTVLGLKATRVVLPLEIASGFAQLIRDFLSLDPEDKLLKEWRVLDSLTVLNLLSERTPNLRKFSTNLTEQVDSWMEGKSEEIPLLYREWIRGEKEKSKATEVLGSLGIRSKKTGLKGNEWARQQAYLAIFASMILYERGSGISIPEIERRWNLSNFEGIEERWRDDLMWLLSGLGEIIDLRCFYYHLREECKAEVERVQRVKRLLKRMRSQVFELQEHLKYCSPLGPVLRSIRRVRASNHGKGSTIGVQTIRRLEEAGIQSLTQLNRLQVDDMVRLGVRRDYAKQIRQYLIRRMQ